MSRTALIVVDIQNDYFPGGKWTLDAADAAADNAARVIAATRAAGHLLVHIRHEFTSENPPFFAPGSRGAEIHPKAGALPHEHVIVKNFVNSFRETELKAVLDRHGIEDVTIIGSMSHMCIDAAARAANDFGYKVTVVHDACATLDLEFNGVKIPAAQVHAAFMAALSFGYAAVLSTDAYLAS